MSEERLWVQWDEGRMYDAWTVFGAHPGPEGTVFTVWAPNAREVRVSGDFCDWGEGNTLLPVGRGIWRGTVPGAREGSHYKYVISTSDGKRLWKADPFAFFAELRPDTASIVRTLQYTWKDKAWMEKRRALEGPLNIYEVHPGSWKRRPDGGFLTWRELAEELVPYVKEMGYTHVELMPVTEHPLDASWGYQATGYFAATSRFGDPEGLMYLIDRFHRAGIGVILDWVPGHFCRDEHGLGRFDGTPLYESGDHPGWGTYKFDLARGGVRSFLISSALFWLNVYHADGLRVDGVSSMLYLNFGIDDPGQKKFNIHGTEEDLVAVDFVQELNRAVGEHAPGAVAIAEESTAWPLVTYPPEAGGLGFHYKWDMGWMNDTLRYISEDFPGRQINHGLLTFSMMYAFSENFILPLSHDEVVHGKRSIIGRMPGDWWRQFAGARLLQMYAACHPGGMLNFMGNEIAQFIEWRYDEPLEWFLLSYNTHAGHRQFVRELNALYRKEKALWEQDRGWEGFQWMDADNWEQGILSFCRRAKDGETVLCVLNFRPESREKWRAGVPLAGGWKELLSSDEERFGGSGKRNPRKVRSRKVPCHGQEDSIVITVPPLGGTILKYMG